MKYVSGSFVFTILSSILVLTASAHATTGKKYVVPGTAIVTGPTSFTCQGTSGVCAIVFIPDGPIELRSGTHPGSGFWSDQLGIGYCNVTLTVSELINGLGFSYLTGSGSTSVSSEAALNACYPGIQ